MQRHGRLLRESASDHLEQHAVPDASLVHDDPLHAERPGESLDRGGPGENDVGPIRAESSDLLPLPERCFLQPVEQVHQVRRAEHVPVRRSRLAMALVLRHRGQGRKRPAAADHCRCRELRLSQVVPDLAPDPPAQRLPFGSADRIRVDVLLGQPDRAERQRQNFIDHGSDDQHQFHAAAAEIDDRGGALVEREVLLHAAERETRFLLGGDDFHLDAIALAGRLDELVPVPGLPDRARRDHPDLVHLVTVRDRLHRAERFERALEGRVADPAGLEQALAEPGLGALVIEDGVRGRALYFRDDEAQRVRAYIDRREAGGLLEPVHAVEARRSCWIRKSAVRIGTPGGIPTCPLLRRVRKPHHDSHPKDPDPALG